MKIRSIRNADLLRKKVLVRADLDVPLTHSKSGDSAEHHSVFSVSVSDDFRLERMAPTFDLLISQMAKVIVIGHVNRPGGQVAEEQRVSPIVDWFSRRFRTVKYARSVVGMEARQNVLALQDGEILFLENLRFDSGEEADRESFAKELSTYGQVFVNECFSSSHRQHASFSALPRLLPSFAGLNLEKEVINLTQVLSHARRPLLVIVGGVKLETKIPVIEKFLGVADKILVTGKIGVAMGKLKHLHSPKLIYSVGDPDILTEELERFSSLIRIAGTIVWNGPTGDVSHGYMEGTKKLAQAIVSSSAWTVVGGGDTCEILKTIGLRERFSFVSTGGGAMLDFLAGKEMPGIKPLLIA